MKVFFVITNDSSRHTPVYLWVDLSIVPRLGEWVQVEDFLEKADWEELDKTAICWSGSWGEVTSVTLRKNVEGWYYYIWIECEDR